MSEWWTYRPSDFLLFSPQTYYRLFALHNAGLWPAPVLALSAGIVVLLLTALRLPQSGRIVAGLLAVAWAAVAWLWFCQRYATVNWAAPWFGVGFALQVLLLAWYGVIRGRLVFPAGGIAWPAGLALAGFAVLLQPLLPLLFGRPWRQAELFALAPAPTVLATLGVILAATRRNGGLLALPLLWCVLEGFTLWTMEAPDFWLLPGAGVLASLLSIFFKSQRYLPH